VTVDQDLEAAAREFCTILKLDDDARRILDLILSEAFVAGTWSEPRDMECL
jgi:hypothetical protein